LLFIENVTRYFLWYRSAEDAAAPEGTCSQEFGVPDEHFIMQQGYTSLNHRVTAGLIEKA
jgi:hypothetical protein